MPAIITITDLNLPELDLFSRYSESQLYHINEPAPGIFIAESPNVIRRALNAGYEPVSVLIEDRQTNPWIPELFSDYPDLPVYTAAASLLTNLTGFALTRGLLCAMKRKPMPSVEEICKGRARKCCKSNKYRRHLPLSRSARHGCRPTLLRLQRPVLPESRQSQHGNRFPDPVDLFSERGRSLRRRTYTPQSHGIQDCRHGIKGRFRLHR